MGMSLDDRLNSYNEEATTTEMNRQAFIAKAFIQRLTHHDEQTRFNAIKGLAEFGRSADFAIPHLLPLFFGNDSYTRQLVAQTLSKLGPAATEPLLKALSDDRSDVRYHALLALSYLPISNTDIQMIAQYMADNDHQVRQAAYNALKRIGTPEALSAMREFFR
jgi:HEAT repeat protein